MPMSLSAFAPLRAREHDLFNTPGVVTATATTLFVDLVGFTPLTDKLGKFGSRGTEQLSEVLQGFFGGVTARALANGGDPVAYGGDALTIVFDGHGPETVAAAGELAESIHLMSTETNQIKTLAGTVSLQTRIGIGRGPVTTTVIRANERSLCLQLGVGLDRAAEAEATAEVGQIVYHRSATVDVDRGERTDSDVAHPAGHAASNGTESLEQLIHPAVLQHLLADSSLWQSHRAATVAFIGFPPVRPDEVGDFVGTAELLIHHVDACGGEVVQISGGDKGVVALTVFGAPVGHDDDPLRALQAVLEFRRITPSIRVGMTTGPVFTTWLGTGRRRLQAHFGGALNMAARLMQASESHGVLVDAATWRDAGRYLRQRGSTRRITVKGHADPLEVHGVAGWRTRREHSETPSDLAVVGREAEVGLIEHLLDEVQAARGRALTFEGDPGIGKSRLAREAAARARARSMQILMVDAEDFPYGQMQGVWREIIGRRLGLDPAAKRSQWQAALRRRLPDGSQRLDLLGPVLGLGPRHADAWDELEPHLAVELAQGLVAQLVVDGPPVEPILIVVENAHHFPSVSRSLLDHLQHRVSGSGVGLLVTERTPDASFDTEHRGGHTHRLAELSPAASWVLIEDTWRHAGGGSPPPWLAELVHGRTGGNPLFLLTATSGVKSRWRPGDPPPKQDDDGEDSLAGALNERIDLLDAEQRQVLAVLAVTGRPCRLAIPVAVLAGSVDESAVLAAAQRLQDGDFVRVLEVAHGGTPSGDHWRIRHDLMRHVLYEQMAHADRLRLHRGLYHLLIAQEDGASASEIAQHVRHLDDPKLAREWFPRAGTEARRAWDVASALEWWRLVLAVADGRDRLEAEVELLELRLVGGRAREVLAELQGLDDRQTTTARTSAYDELLVRQRVAFAEAAWAAGDFTSCEAQCNVVLTLTRDQDEGRHQRAAELLVRSMCDRGNLTEAVALARDQLSRAEKTRDAEYLTTANVSLGAALLLSDEPEDAARHYRAALAGAESTGDTIHQIHALSDLAGCAYSLDDYPQCLDLLEQARVLAESIGYRHHLMFSLINEAQLRAGLGDPEAASRARLAIERALELGDLASAAETVHTWLTSDVMLVQDVDFWQRLARVNEGLGRTLHVADCYAAVAVAAARRGDGRLVDVAAQHVRAHPEVTPGSQLDRRVTLARTLLQSDRVPADARAERQSLVREIESLGVNADVGAVEQAELAMTAWRIAPDHHHRGRAVTAVHAAFEAEPSALVRSWFDELGEPTPDDRHRLPPPIGTIGDRPDRTALDKALTDLEDALDRRSAD